MPHWTCVSGPGSVIVHVAWLLSPSVRSPVGLEMAAMKVLLAVAAGSMAVKTGTRSGAVCPGWKVSVAATGGTK